MPRYKGERDVVAILQGRMEELDGRIEKLIHEEGLFPEPWRDVGAAGNPAFENSWGNYASGYSTAAFRRESEGIVRLKGLVRTGTMGLTIFTLPNLYRPPLIMIFPVRSNELSAECRIHPTGSVQAYLGSNVWYCLDGISFVIA